LGIEARAERAARWWRSHLSISRELGLAWLAGGEQLVVLGAGRLLDVDAEQLTSRYKEVHLVDMDPGVLPYWRRLTRRSQGKVVHQLLDITGVLEGWTEELLRFLNAHPRPELEGLSKLLISLPTLAPQLPTLFQKGCDVLSLNLLGQIPIYWHDRVLEAVRSCWGLQPNRSGELPEPLGGALRVTLANLQAHHLALLANSNARVVVLICDDEFYHYQRENSNWLVEPALYVKRLELPGYTATDHDSWLWHIAPQGVETPEHGAIHRIVAYRFERTAPLV